MSGAGRIFALQMIGDNMAQIDRVRACAVIVAGGSGVRFGNPGGKLLIDVAGKPLITWTLEAFESACSVCRIIIVCPPDKVEEMRVRAIDPFTFATPIEFTPSGAERQDSTRSGLDAVPADCDIVLVHDAARPLVLPETIDAAIEALVTWDADLRGVPEEGDVADPSRVSLTRGGSSHVLDGVVCGHPSVDTLKVVDADGCFVETPPRSRFWAVQTPQVFWADSLRRAYDWVDRTGFVGTDDSSLVEGMGGRVRGFDSPRDNLKVTLPEDLAPVEAVLRARI